MNFKILLTFLMTIGFCSCNGQNTNANNITTATPMPINRFDKALFQLINSDDTTLKPTAIEPISADDRDSG